MGREVSARMTGVGRHRAKRIEKKQKQKAGLTSVRWFQLSWHRGPVAGVVGEVAAEGETEKGGRRQIA